MAFDFNDFNIFILNYIAKIYDTIDNFLKINLVVTIRK